MKVFISYAKEDVKAARKLYKDLKEYPDISPWLDIENLLPGQNWKNAISEAIKRSSYFIMLLSQKSISKKGYIQKEQKIALDMLDEYNSSDIFIIPVRLEDCIPTNEKIKDLHWVDLFESYEDSLIKILKVIKPDYEDTPQFSPYYGIRKETHEKSKLAVAKKIVDDYLTQDNVFADDLIVLDAGTSITPIAQLLIEKISYNQNKAFFTILTHNYDVFQCAIKKPILNLNVILTGGVYDSRLNAFWGHLTVNAYKECNPKVTIIGVSSISSERGIFGHLSPNEEKVKEYLCKKPTKDRIIVADYTKIGMIDSYCLCGINELTEDAERCIIVTDKPNGNVKMKEQLDKFNREIEKINDKGIHIEII